MNKLLVAFAAASTALTPVSADAAVRLNLTFTANLSNGDNYGGVGEFELDDGTADGADTLFSIVSASGSATYLGGPGPTASLSLGEFPSPATVRLSGGVYSLVRVGLDFDIAPGYLLLNTPVNATRIDGFAGDGVRVQLNYALTPQVDAAVPEPATWAMLIAGFGLAGAAMRRRRVAVAFA